MQKPAGETADGDDKAKHVSRTTGKRAEELLEALTIRELIIELGKAEAAARGSSADQLDTRKTTRRERAIIEELHRRRCESVPGVASPMSASDKTTNTAEDLNGKTDQTKASMKKPAENIKGAFTR